MWRPPPAAPIGTAAKVPPQSAPSGVREATGARTRGRHRNRRGQEWVGSSRGGGAFLMLPAATTSAVHLALAAARVNAPRASAPPAVTAGRVSSATTLPLMSVSPYN